MLAVLVPEAGFRSSRRRRRQIRAAWGEIDEGSFNRGADLPAIYKLFEGKGEPPGAQSSDKCCRQDVLAGDGDVFDLDIAPPHRLQDVLEHPLVNRRSSLCRHGERSLVLPEYLYSFFPLEGGL